MFSHVATHISVYHVTSLDKIVHYGLAFLGTAGVGVFFLFSGYGNYIHLGKCVYKKEIVKWFIKNLLRIYTTYIICVALTEVILVLLMGEKLILKELLQNFVILSVKHVVTWYIKIQLLLYIFAFISFMLFREKPIFPCMILCIVYILIAHMFGLENYWYNMVLCFPIGMLFAENKEYIETAVLEKLQHPFIIIIGLVITAFIYTLRISFGYLNIFYELFLCSFLSLGLTLFLCSLNPHNKIIRHVGSYSFEIYLVHSAFIYKFINAHHTNLHMIILFLTISLVIAIIAHKIIHIIIEWSQKLMT